MNYKIGIIALVALQAYAAIAQRPCVCARNYRPVCGSDGKTYSTECTLNCQKYKDKSDLTVASIGRCNEDSCICTMDYTPVCGNDGKTYPNSCAMDCTRSTNPTIAVAHQGQCEEPCICPDILQEVCGSDGNTYDNDCVLNCQTAKDHTLSIKHAGKCETVKVADIKLPLCTCARDLKPVCGSDGKTYTNDCLLNCATANDSTLSVSHPGECGKVNVVNNGPSGCICSRNLKPVCGSNGVTYNNECLLACAGQTVAGYGECQVN